MVTVTRPMKSPGRPRLSEEIKDQVVQAYNQGGNCKAITARYGIGKSSFYRIIKERQEENNARQIKKQRVQPPPRLYPLNT